MSFILIPVAKTDEIMERMFTRDSSGHQQEVETSQQTESRPRNLNVDDMLILQSCFDGKLVLKCICLVTILLRLFDTVSIYVTYMQLT